MGGGYDAVATLIMIDVLLVFVLFFGTSIALLILRAPPKVVDVIAIIGSIIATLVYAYDVNALPVLFGYSSHTFYGVTASEAQGFSMFFSLILIGAMFLAFSLLSISVLSNRMYLSPRKKVVVPRAQLAAMAKLQRQMYVTLTGKYIDIIPPGVSRNFPPALQKALIGYENVREIYNVVIPDWFKTIYELWRRGMLMAQPNEIIVVTTDATYRITLMRIDRRS